MGAGLPYDSGRHVRPDRNPKGLIHIQILAGRPAHVLGGHGGDSGHVPVLVVQSQAVEFVQDRVRGLGAVTLQTDFIQTDDVLLGPGQFRVGYQVLLHPVDDGHQPRVHLVPFGRIKGDVESEIADVQAGAVE